MYAFYPAQVLDPGDRDGVAVVNVRGERREVAVLGLDTHLRPGDWLLVESRAAVARIDENEAAERWRLLDEFPERTA
jgi:hydrogenase maturation factor